MQIKFGTDGWRAIIADDYTVENVKRVAHATALYMKQNGMDKVVIGHDCRFGGELFAETTARVMGMHGIKVHLAKDFVSTPMVSLGVVKTKSGLGVVITASHNPPSYNGFKIKNSLGGPALPNEIADVEALIPERFEGTLPKLEDMIENGLLSYIDLESLYVHEVQENFDLAAIRASGIKVGYDAMFGAGQRVMQRLLPNNLETLHCDPNPSFEGQAPEPIARNLEQLSDLIKDDPSIACGLANDGDADRIGMFDHKGEFVDSHHLLLLLTHYLYQYKDMRGKVVITFSVTDKMKQLCEHYGLPYEVTKIGFKYIAEIMKKEAVLCGGEESGGIAVMGHIPERDGIWTGLLILEFMAKTGKSLRELIEEVYAITGPFSFDRNDLKLEESQKLAIIEKCKAGTFKNFGKLKVVSTEDLDGYKFNLSDSEWLMVRPSGTEPLLRVYAQAPTLKAAQAILEEACEALLDS